MVIDIQNLVEIIAKKANQVDSDASATTLKGYLNILERQGLGSVEKVANEQSLPLASTETTKRLTYNEALGAVYFRNSEGWRRTEFPQYTGITAGFWAGGSSYLTDATTTISKVEFASDTITGEHGTLSEGTYNASGTTSATDGYVAGGSFFPNPTAALRFSKFPFASATPVSASPLTPSHPQGQRNNSSASDIAGGKGYQMDQSPAPSNPAPGVRWSHPFANDVPITQATGNMNGSKEFATGLSSETKAYRTGGAGTPNNPFVGGSSDIQSFPFASDVDAVAITATLVNALQQQSSASGTDEYGYIFAGEKGSSPPLSQNLGIERFPFASEDTSVSTGTLESGTQNTAGVSGISSAYFYKGGYFQKFNYGATTTVSTIVDLSGTPAATRNNRATGHQY